LVGSLGTGGGGGGGGGWGWGGGRGRGGGGGAGNGRPTTDRPAATLSLWKAGPHLGASGTRRHSPRRRALRTPRGLPAAAPGPADRHIVGGRSHRLRDIQTFWIVWFPPTKRLCPIASGCGWQHPCGEGGALGLEAEGLPPRPRRPLALHGGPRRRSPPPLPLGAAAPLPSGLWGGLGDRDRRGWTARRRRGGGRPIRPADSLNDGPHGHPSTVPLEERL